MVRRIALWALAGLLVAFAWYLYFRIGGPTVPLGRSVLPRITVPAALLMRRETWQESLVLNALVYAGLGLVVELARLTWQRGVGGGMGHVAPR
jgi:hypothetical protein